ncbi:copper resistance protein CopC [Curtobacterium sp. MCPF17_002]|uniref:copper resistance CopC family protein n=1 Tax=Curtobacterium sp. MCPF17_002 TaxID=2175645 RepID=UPI000DA8FB51|nr:copper resistance protein CopC [Curtobacterium sp. MCPF17_002]WIB77489.1 copper resistance protein CopC [Curtobacterium sp. MCPF17_002]
MSPVQPRRNRRRGTTLVVLMLAAVCSGVFAGVASPASAHSALTASTPAAGAEVPSDLDRVDLTFSEAPIAGLDAGLRIEVRDADGSDESTGDVIVSGTTMSKAVDLSAGPHTVLWRYVSPDGHPVDGQIDFTVRAAASSSAASGAPSAPAAPTASPSASPSAAATADAGVSGGPFVWVLGGVVAVLVAGSVVAVVRRGRRA